MKQVITHGILAHRTQASAEQEVKHLLKNGVKTSIVFHKENGGYFTVEK